jgi:hypothetical protein
MENGQAHTAGSGHRSHCSLILRQYWSRIRAGCMMFTLRPVLYRMDGRAWPGAAAASAAIAFQTIRILATVRPLPSTFHPARPFRRPPLAVPGARPARRRNCVAVGTIMDRRPSVHPPQKPTGSVGPVAAAGRYRLPSREVRDVSFSRAWRRAGTDACWEKWPGW